MKLLLTMILGVATLPLAAQPGPGAAKGKQAARPAREAAPVDFTGNWVSVVTEDWRWRMVTPSVGDFAGLPLTPVARREGNSWTPTTDEASGDQCKAYGAPNIMRLPGRLRITWQDENTLKIETDQGQQTRLLHFTPVGNPAASTAAPPNTTPSRQGGSAAQWEPPVRGLGTPQAGLGATREGARGRSLEVVTTNLTAGYLRKNGAPHSANAIVKEFFDLSTERNGDTWFVVTTIVEDPRNLTEPYVTSTNFKKEPDGTKFKPAACTSK
jgi:hypothetical protein